MATDEAKRPVPVYSSWTTITNALESLSQGVPQQIDRTLFPGLNWGVQTRLLAGFRFLGLTDDKGNTQPTLVSLAEDREKRKDHWRAILKEAYKDVFNSVDLGKASPLQLSQAIERYGLGGDTRDKAVRFFLSAAEFSGIPLSPHLKNQRVAVRARKKSGTVRAKPNPKDINFWSITSKDGRMRSDPEGGVSQTITLRTGGTLTLSVSINLFALRGEDRSFVFDLIDRLQDYDQASAQTETPASAGTAERA